MATSLVGELALVLSQCACLVGLIVFLIAPVHCHGHAFSLSGQLLEASSEHADDDAARHTTSSVQFPAQTLVSSDDVLVFQTSSFLGCVGLTTVSPPSEHEPPVRVVIASPTQHGTYPVILFKHGFVILNCFYTKLFELLATSGYIVVAPQYFDIADIWLRDCTREINETAAVANWIQSSLKFVLNAAIADGHVVPDMSKFVMAGHSRGGKVAFAMVLGKAAIAVPSFSALVALDPVDGISVDQLLKPPLVACGCSHTRNRIAFPVLILGTGYGKEGLLPACAPTSSSHEAYFNCSSAPIIYHLVASEYGHVNFLDESAQCLWDLFCKSGTIDAKLYSFTAELIVAFLESALNHNPASMDNLLDNWKTSSFKLEEPQVYREDDALYVKETAQMY